MSTTSMHVAMALRRTKYRDWKVHRACGKNMEHDFLARVKAGNSKFEHYARSGRGSV